MQILSYIEKLIGYVSRLFQIFPRRILKGVKRTCEISLLPGDMIKLEQDIFKRDKVRFEGRWIDSVEAQPSNETDLVQRLILSFRTAKQMQSKVSEPYL